MMMNKFYTPISQNQIKFYKFNTFEYYCNYFLKKKKKPKLKIGSSSNTNKTAFYFDQCAKLDALLDKYFIRMNNQPDFSEESETFKKVNDETDQFIQTNEKLLSCASKDVIFCIKKIMRMKEKVDFFNTHFFSNSINIIVFIRSQISQFFESKPNIISNPDLIYSSINPSKNSSKSDSKVSKKDDKFDYSYDKAGFDVECSADEIESFFEKEFRNSPIIKKTPQKIISLCTYIHKHLVGRFQQLGTEDISQTITAMSCIYDPDLLYIIPNIVDDFLNNYLQDIAPNDFEELRNVSVQIMSQNFYKILHRIDQPAKVTISHTNGSESTENSIVSSQSNTMNDCENSIINDSIEIKNKNKINNDNDNEIKAGENDNSVLNDKKGKKVNEDDDCISIEYVTEDSYSTEESKSDSKTNSIEKKQDEMQNPGSLPNKLSSKHVFRDINASKISFAPLRKFIYKYCKIFNINYSIPKSNEKKPRKKKPNDVHHELSGVPTKERMVLRCSFVRILCNIIYTSFPGFLYEPINLKFFQACEKVRISTPKEMEINPKILCDYMMNLSFIKLVESDDLYINNKNLGLSSNSSSDQLPNNTPKKRKRSLTYNSKKDKNVQKKENELKEASNLINETQFITNPIDLINNVHNALNLINKFFQKCEIVKKFGTLNCKISLDENENHSIMEMNSNFLAFDDIFPLFCMVISYASPSNAVAVSDFLSRTEDLKLGSQFEFSKLLFTSAIEYIINDVENDLSKFQSLQKS